MRKSEVSTHTSIAPSWRDYLTLSLFFPLLTLYAFYLAGDYFLRLHLFAAPDFWSQNLYKANFVCFAPALLSISLVGNLHLYCPQRVSVKVKTRIATAIVWFTLSLVLVVNTLLLVLHFSFFSADRYIRCWEPFPSATWYYARTAKICEQHGLAPVRFLNVRSTGESAVAR